MFSKIPTSVSLKYKSSYMKPTMKPGGTEIDNMKPTERRGGTKIDNMKPTVKPRGTKIEPR